ncbi:BamA/TamA family outer membrane protein [bacterium]|nr:BamA/TamA family outer membrane protein [bacterium]
MSGHLRHLRKIVKLEDLINGRVFLVIVFCLVSQYGNSAAISQDKHNEQALLITYKQRNDNGEPVIYAIEVIGNRRTSTDLILREMKLKPGMIVTEKDLIEDQKRIASLGLFNRVEMKLAADEGRAVVQVDVTEPFYIYPYIYTHYEIDKPNEAKIGLGIYHNNFHGMGQKLGFLFSWGEYESSYKLLYSDPWFSIGNRYGLNGSIYHSSKEITDHQVDSSRIEKTSVEKLGVVSSIRRRLAHRHYYEIGIGWDDIKSDTVTYTFSGKRDQIIYLMFDYKLDKRDYRYYPASGYYVFFEIVANRLIDFEHYFYREAIDLRIFKRFAPLIVAIRTWGGFGQQVLPSYRCLSVGRELFRVGEPFSIKKGMVIGGNLELRFPIISERYYSFGKVPLAGPYLRNLKFSLEGVIFSDRGFYTNVNDGFAYGCGVQMQLPYVQIVHFLIGWTPLSRFNEPSITIRNGVTF